MLGTSHAVVISRPIEAVFAFFTDPENDPRWREHVVSIHAEGPIAVGSRVSQSVTGPGGRPIRADLEVTAFEPSAHYAFRVVAGPVRPVGDFRFTEVGANTRVDFSLTAELTGLNKLFMSGPVERSMETEVHGLHRAKAILESE